MYKVQDDLVLKNVNKNAFQLFFLKKKYFERKRESTHVSRGGAERESEGENPKHALGLISRTRRS